jgi:predicted nucleic acid-binding protein
MRVLLDTTALNWLTDNPGSAEEFLQARRAGRIEVLVTPEAANEIRDTKDPLRRAALEAMLTNFFPLTPTRVPRFGAFRSGLGRVAQPADMSRLDALQFLHDGQDRNLATNAGGYRCDVFLTRDQEMSSKKRTRVEAQLGGTRVLTPEAFMLELNDR